MDKLIKVSTKQFGKILKHYKTADEKVEVFRLVDIIKGKDIRIDLSHGVYLLISGLSFSVETELNILVCFHLPNYGGRNDEKIKSCEKMLGSRLCRYYTDGLTKVKINDFSGSSRFEYRAGLNNFSLHEWEDIKSIINELFPNGQDAPKNNNK